MARERFGSQETREEVRRLIDGQKEKIRASHNSGTELNLLLVSVESVYILYERVRAQADLRRLSYRQLADYVANEAYAFTVATVANEITTLQLAPSRRDDIDKNTKKAIMRGNHLGLGALRQALGLPIHK